MGMLQFFRRLFTPNQLEGPRVVRERPLHEQFQRIGGGITPLDVSGLLQQADAGQPGRLIDLANESRQKDGHLHSVLQARELGVSSLKLEFIAPDDATPEEEEAVQLCNRIADDFENWHEFIEHLTGSFYYGHAHAEIMWEQQDGLLLPKRAYPIPARHFIFNRTDGSLRFSRGFGDTEGLDLLTAFPGRIVQVQRRITGDVPVREGLMRVLVWAALFRNWTLKDWLALAEIGWKPWRIAKYKKDANQEAIDRLIAMLEAIGSRGIAAIPETTELGVEWPKSSGTTQKSTHAELFDVMGREMSKATIGTTDLTESGPNGSRSAVETRDLLRADIKEADARAVGYPLRRFLFAPAVEVNLGPNVRVPVPWFVTREARELKSFSEAVDKLARAGVRIPQRWVRDEGGIPEPEDDEELVIPIDVDLSEDDGTEEPAVDDEGDGDGNDDQDEAA